MSILVTGLFVAQLLVGGYLYSFVLGAGQRSSNARATRIPDLVAFVHPLAAIVTFSCWLAYLANDDKTFAWATFALLLLTASGGAVMALKTLTGSPVVDRPSPRQGILDPGDPAEVRVAEKQIPRAAVAVHGLIFLVLTVGTLLVALDAVD
ncbi:hypothetical protein KVF89_06880 [Nocardioides carbamazepini]|uniref:hypothetical protein n=1 Tax=Nocardioides carbamazepini TaxID=2854259 RepID=UPI00214A1A91|nr:hypothetical protein [Nocardioides carbamazepini]MCR1782252.1 hypothetical protein [Nocardioides carbamazepini]